MREEKKKKRTKVGAASRFAFMSTRVRRARIREKKGDSPPFAFASERGVPCTCSESGSGQRGQEKRKKKRMRKKAAAHPKTGQGEGSIRREDREKARPKAWGEREEAASCCRRRVMGEDTRAREKHDLESFESSTRHKVNRGNFPKVTRHSFVTPFSPTSAPLLPRFWRFLVRLFPFPLFSFSFC
jgi:hypothetical protein